MVSIADRVLASVDVGAPTELPREGTWLEDPYLYDRVAWEMQCHAERGTVEILQRQQQRTISGQTLVSHLQFRRLR